MATIARRLCSILGLAMLSGGVLVADVFLPGTYFTLAPDGLSYNGTAIPIGGTNPTPVSATLTGTFSPTTGTGVGSGSILPSFSVTLSDSPTLMDGDDVVIEAIDASTSALYPVAVLSWDLIFPGNAGEFDITNLTGPNALPPDFPITTAVNLTDLTLTVNFGATPTVPEPGAWALLLTVIACLVCLTFARGGRATGCWKGRIRALSATKVLLPVICLVAAQAAFSQVVLTSETTPSSGVAGVTNVSLIGSGFPGGTINAGNIVVTLATTCDGPAAATSLGNTIKKIIGSTERVNFNIPNGIKTGTYFVTIADSASGDADFTTQPGSCSQLQVTSSIAILNACVAGSSMGVLLPGNGAGGNVTAYVPQGYWSGGGRGIFVQNIEGAINPPVNIATPNIPNSCSSNPATGQTVCVANNTDVYLVTGTTLTNTLTSGSNGFASFSGGSCNNCGVAVNAANNTAVINMGANSGPGGSGDGVQILNLSTNTFSPAFETNQTVSENISVDPTRTLILSANERGNYMILQIQPDGSLKEFDATFSSGIEDDSSAEDCSTGVAIAPGEFTDSVQLVNLNNITFGATTYTAPNTVATLSTSYGFSAGLSGSAVAQGSGHLAVVTGEFGGNTFAVLQLPSTPSTGTPALADYAVAAIPSNAACGGSFSAGFDPHTITAYTSPNTGDAYAVFAGYTGGTPMCLAVVDMTTIIDPAKTPRGGGGLGAHDISAANLPASAVTFFKLR
jgi:hypothetical protein